MLKILHIFSKIEDINARYRINDPKLTPLMLACASNQLDVAEFLLSSFDDIDINATFGIETSTLQTARSYEMRKLMIEMSKQRNLGINVNAKNLVGITPLFSARDVMKSMEILIANGADVLARTNEGEDIFTEYWKHSNEKFLEYLNVTEELTILQRLELFINNLDFLSEAIPKKGKLEVPHTISNIEGKERRRCRDQRFMLFFLKTFRDQNIDLRLVEEQFVNAEK